MFFMLNTDLYYFFNPFQPNVSFLFPQKTQGNLWFYVVFTGYGIGILAQNELGLSEKRVSLKINLWQKTIMQKI